MKGGEESSTCAATQPKAPSLPQQGLPLRNPNNTKNGEVKNKENLWCNYCTRKGHVKETCWTLKGRPPLSAHDYASILKSRGNSDRSAMDAELHTFTIF